MIPQEYQYFILDQKDTYGNASNKTFHLHVNYILSLPQENYYYYFSLRSIFEDRVEMWFVNDIFVDFFTVRLKGIKVINYPQIKIWIYRGYKNQFVERM